MATCSISREYARIEFDGVKDRERREKLLDHMHECRHEIALLFLFGQAVEKWQSHAMPLVGKKCFKAYIEPKGRAGSAQPQKR